MPAMCEVELECQIIDSGMMGACFGIVMDVGGSVEVEAFEIGRHETEESYARLQVAADDFFTGSRPQDSYQAE